MPKVISANSLADGIVVYAGRTGAWTGQLGQAKIFTSKADAEEGLLGAENDAKHNLVVEPFLVEVVEDASGPRAVTLRDSIRARGPTIDFLPRTQAFAYEADTPLENAVKQETNGILRNRRVEAARAHELLGAAASPDVIAR
jgi:Protein of unknown function (DUF2849)